VYDESRTIDKNISEDASRGGSVPCVDSTYVKVCIAAIAMIVFNRPATSMQY